MFKRSLAAAVAVAAISTGVVAPAQAAPATNKMDGDVCVISGTDTAGKPVTSRVTQDEAKEALAKLPKAVEALEALKADPKTTPSQIESAEKVVKALEDAAPAYRACAAGKEIGAGSSAIESEFSSVDGKISAAGIGAIVGLISLVLTAAMPAIFPMLPPQVQAMVPAKMREGLKF